MTGVISKYESEVHIVFEWKIQMVDFFKFSEGDGSHCCSPDFTFGGEVWFLHIYPNGSSRNDSFGYVDLELWKCNSDRSIIQSFSLSLKTANDEKYNEQHFINDFGRCYPDNYKQLLRFIPRSAFTRRRSELVPEGVLTVVCTMKRWFVSSAGSATTIKKEEGTGWENNTQKPLFGCVASASAESRHCEMASDTVILSSHRNKCIHRRVKCLDCLAVIEFDEHECQKKRTEAAKDLEHEDVCSQTVRASIQNPENSTQTVGAPIQNPENSTQTVGASIQNPENSTQTVGEKCETFASGSSTNPQENKVLHDFKELFLHNENCDVIIKVKGSELLPAHRIILKARSPVFASTFRHDMKENTTGVLEIQDRGSSTYSDLLCFLYYRDVSIISQENVFSLFIVADRYQDLNLRAKCLEFMKKNVTVDTFCETISLALQHSETELIELCTDYFKKNVLKIIVTAKWQTFLAENPTESNELLVKFFAPNSS